MRRSELMKKKQKQNTGFDPFSTLACRPQILWNTQKKVEGQTPKNNQQEAEFGAKKREEKAKEKEEELKKSMENQKTDFEKAVIRKEKFIERIKKVNLNIEHLISKDPNDFSKFPPLNKAPVLSQIHPTLKRKLQEKHQNDLLNDKRKVYTVDEYLTKYNIS